MRCAVEVFPFVPVIPMSFKRSAGLPCQFADASESAPPSVQHLQICYMFG